MDMKVEIKDEPCFQDFYSENERDTKDFVKQVKIEISDSDIKPVVEDSKCFSLNEEDQLMKFNETIKESEIETKIDIKEEHWWLEREDSCVRDDIDDETHEDFYSTRPPNSCKGVSNHTSHLSSTEDLEDDVSFNMNMDSPECGSDRNCQGQESAVTDISSTQASVCSETSNDGKIVSMVSCLKQGKLLQQSNTNKQDINTENCNSILSHEYTQSHKCNVCKKCSKYSSHLKKCRLVHDCSKVNKCEVLKKGLYQLSLKLIDEGKKTCKSNIRDKSFTCLQHSKTHKVNNESIKPHKCNICYKAFTNLSNLKRHKFIHAGIKPHKCDTCNKTFTRLSDLNRHKLVHEGIKLHKCNICNMAFADLSNLKRHTFNHEGIKPHKCDICKKAFTTSSSLRNHKLIHENIKPHKCIICSKVFTKSSNLKNHKLIHEDIKQHKCNVCKKTFADLSRLKRHKFIHAGVKPHKCDICNKAFTTSSSLRNHKLIHEHIKPHKCNTCNRAFGNLSNLKRHIRSRRHKTSQV